MGYVHGSRTVVMVGANTVKCTSSALTREQEMHDVGRGESDTGAKVFHPGQHTGKFTMSGVYDNTAGTGPKAVFEAVLAAQKLDVYNGIPTVITRRPEGTGAGKAQEVFGALLNSYVETDPVADMVTWQADWQISDDINTTPQS